MKLYIKILTFFCSSLLLTSTYAAGPLDYFEVVLGREAAMVWEAMDITISAVDKNWEIITDYTGDILVFSESDAEAEFPNELAENSYSFTNVNEWSVKFENAVKFKNPGVQDVYVYDLNDENILWVAEVTISEQEAESNVEITILSPEKWVTLWSNSITVSGTTKKNHQVRIIVNNDQDLFTTSNADGVFEKNIENLTQGTNSIKAQVLNSESEKIWESELIDIKINSSAPEFKRITITPTWKVEQWSDITIEVVSNAWLSEVKAIINDIITKLSEWKDGIYTAATKAPWDVWEYPVDIILADEFANESSEKNVETLIIIEKTPELTAWGEEPEIVEIVSDTPKNTELELDIKNIEVTELKTKSVITWDAPKDAESYNIYMKVDENKVELLENILEPRYEIEITGEEIRYDYFSIKALWKTSSWETIQWDLSEMTKVKTGPELIVLGFVAILLSAGFFYFRRETA